MSKSSKKCETYCKKDFLLAREQVEADVAKTNHTKYIYLDKHPNKDFSKTMKKIYMDLCKVIYCNRGCNGSKQDFVSTVDDKRKKVLTKKGVESVCRDLKKEYPKYYKSKKNI